MDPWVSDYESNLPPDKNWKLMNTTTLVLNTNVVSIRSQGRRLTDDTEISAAHRIWKRGKGPEWEEGDKLHFFVLWMSVLFVAIEAKSLLFSF